MKNLNVILITSVLMTFGIELDAQADAGSTKSQSFFSYSKGEIISAELVSNSSIVHMLEREGYFLFNGEFYPPLPPERDILKVEKPTFEFLGDRYLRNPDDYYKGTGEKPPEEKFDPAL